MGTRTDSASGGSPTLPLGSMDSLTDLLKNPGMLIPGISNFKTEKDEEKGIITVSCDFADLNSLNKFLGANMPARVAKKNVKMGFQQKGNTLTFTDPLITFFDENSENLKTQMGSATDYMGTMSALFRFETVIRFPVEVKKTSGNKGYQTDMEKKSLKFNFGYNQIQDKKLRKPLKIKL